MFTFGSPSIVKQKVKIKGSMVGRKRLIGMVWREREIPTQCRKFWTKILGIYIYIYIYMWHEWGSVGYFEWVGM